MNTLIKGTSVELIVTWILAIKQDIKENKFYCIGEDQNYLCITPINKARLLVMYSIFHMCYDEEIRPNYFHTREGLVKECQEKMIAYLETMKLLLDLK